MQNAKNWLVAAVVIAALGGTAVIVDMVSTRSAQAQVIGPDGDYWRNHNGHWSYWHAGDKRWYYTDGNHWYYNQGKAWHLYNFDRGFGRTGFHRGEYRVPGPDAKVVHPRHDVYTHP